MFVTLIAETWLKEKLEADPVLAALKVYSYVAPPNAEHPFIIFRLEPGPDTHDTVGLGGTRIKTNLGYLVEVVSKTNNFDSLGPTAERIDAVLHRQVGSVPGGRIISCIRKAPYADLELDEFGGTIYRHLGGIFELQVQTSE